MAKNFGLVSKNLRGKVALMFLKMYPGLSCTKLKIQPLHDTLAEQLKQRELEEILVMPEPTTENTSRRKKGKTLSERNLPG